jgi:hypothetical protein
MANLRLRDLIDLVTGEVVEPEARIEKMYEWYVERRTTVAKWWIGASGTVLAAIAASFMKAELQIPAWEIAFGVLGALVAGGIGFWRFYALRTIAREYVAAAYLFAELKRIAPFLQLYRAAADDV